MTEHSVAEWLRRDLLRTIGLLPPITRDEIEANLHVVRDANFDDLRNNRLRMGYVRYESRLGATQRPGGYLGYAFRALQNYAETKNKEQLIDAANYIEREWQCPSFEATFFEAEDHPEAKE